MLRNWKFCPGASLFIVQGIHTMKLYNYWRKLCILKGARVMKAHATSKASDSGHNYAAII